MHNLQGSYIHEKGSLIYIQCGNTSKATIKWTLNTSDKTEIFIMKLEVSHPSNIFLPIYATLTSVAKALHLATDMQLA